MIDIQVKIHDKFSVEFKVGFIVGEPKPKPDTFALNMWIFTPNSLDINSDTYSKNQFYRDIKSNVRLITPVFLLREIATGKAEPLKNLVTTFRALASSPTREKMADYEYEIKMFMAIFKSSIRDEIFHIMSVGPEQDLKYLTGEMLTNLRNITTSYRQLRHIINAPTVTPEIYNYFVFGDEFLSNTIEKQVFRLINNIEAQKSRRFRDTLEKLAELVNSEVAYRRSIGLPVADKESPTRNREVVFRQSLLKKYIESDLFLDSRKKKDGVAIEQIYLSIAAGISMVFATAVAFSFQLRYGNFTTPLFFALVISYMLKDRIKDMMRYFFAHRLKGKYFDNKTRVSVKDQPVGMIREGFDFITDTQVPSRVMELRARSPLLQAESRINDEKIILYRKMVQLDSELLHEEDRYSVAGINDIMRLYLSSFILKTDNPDVPFYTIDEDLRINCVYGDKVYYLNIVVQLQHDEQLEYRRYRVTFNRTGILDLDELSDVK